jgi:hypothetical protein
MQFFERQEDVLEFDVNDSVQTIGKKLQEVAGMLKASVRQIESSSGALAQFIRLFKLMRYLVNMNQNQFAAPMNHCTLPLENYERKERIMSTALYKNNHA